MSTYNTRLEDELRRERNEAVDSMYAISIKNDALKRQIARQNRYIAELEKQLEYLEPGLVKEAQEWVERNYQ